MTSLLTNTNCETEPLLCNLKEFINAFDVNEPLTPLFTRNYENNNTLKFDNNIIKSIRIFLHMIHNNITINHVSQIPIIITVKVDSKSNKFVNHTSFIIIIPIYEDNDDEGYNDIYYNIIGSKLYTFGIQNYVDWGFYANLVSPDIRPIEMLDKSSIIQITNIEPLTLNYIGNIKRYVNNHIIDIEHFKDSDSGYNSVMVKTDIHMNMVLPKLMSILTNKTRDNCATFAEKMSYKRRSHKYTVKGKILSTPNNIYSVNKNIPEFINDVLQNNQENAVQWLLDIYNEHNGNNNNNCETIGGRKRRYSRLRYKRSRKSKRNKYKL